MRFTKISETVFKEIQLNAGVLLSEFDPTTPPTEEEMLQNILGATTGGVNFSAAPTYSDYGADIDNCPKNMKELKQLESWEISMSGTYITMTPALARSMIGAADIDGTDTSKITPRNDLLDSDFIDLWWVGDYSDKNDDTNGGMIAIHMLNTLSTGGFSIQSNDKAKGQFSFSYTAHYSMSAQDTVPFEMYVKAGTDAAGG